MADKCTTNVGHCRHVMFGETIVWAGEQATQVTPSVVHAAAAFGISTSVLVGVQRSRTAARW